MVSTSPALAPERQLAKILLEAPSAQGPCRVGGLLGLGPQATKRGSEQPTLTTDTISTVCLLLPSYSQSSFGAHNHLTRVITAKAKKLGHLHKNMALGAGLQTRAAWTWAPSALHAAPMAPVAVGHALHHAAPLGKGQQIWTAPWFFVHVAHC